MGRPRLPHTPTLGLALTDIQGQQIDRDRVMEKETVLEFDFEFEYRFEYRFV